MKKCIVFLVTLALCLGMLGCLAGPPEEELSDEEVVIALIEAFKQGDYEGLQPYIDADNPLHLFFAGIDETTGGDMAPAYRRLHEQLKGSITYTAEAVEGKEAWGTVSVTISMPDYSASIYDAMAAALTDHVENGSFALHDMPAWMLLGAEGEQGTAQETFELHVGSRDGNMVMDTNTNRQFFAMLCGGLKPYLKASITTCTFPDGSVWELLSQGDEIVAMVNTEAAAVPEDYAQAELDAMIQSYEETFAPVDGVFARAEVQDGLLYARLGVNMAEASSFALNNLGLISDRITAGSNGWLSLDSTISAFTREGAECVTETFKQEVE